MDVAILSLLILLSFWMGARFARLTRHITAANEQIEFFMLFIRCVLQVSRILLYLLKYSPLSRSYENLKVQNSIEMINPHVERREKEGPTGMLEIEETHHFHREEVAILI